MSERYPLAPNGVFATIQGEGHLAGTPMVFVRLAGCSVGCPNCDTDYSVAERLTADEIARRVCDTLHPYPSMEWVWVTGGEPTDHDLLSLRLALSRIPHPCLRLALATSGHRVVEHIHGTSRWDWVSVSPHDPAKWVQKMGAELKLVPGLNSIHLKDFESSLGGGVSFSHYFVQPCDGMPETRKECVDWVMGRAKWRVTTQMHKVLQIP